MHLTNRHNIKHLSVFLLSLYLLMSLHFLQGQSKWYVKADAIGINNGTSWANAYTDLQSALTTAASGDQVWVAPASITLRSTLLGT